MGGVPLGNLGEQPARQEAKRRFGDVESSPTDPVTVLGGSLALVAIGLLGSLVPALRATRVDPMLTLREQ
jgi:ABC-type lipoprotein release transport system permease subunit